MNFKTTAIILALVFVFENVYAQKCGQPTVAQRRVRLNLNDTGRIVGGVEARPNSFPWIVSMQMGGRHFCGGTLLRVNNQEQTDIVVTAAHCVYDGVSGLEVVAGAHDLRKQANGQQRVSAQYTEYHAQYDPNTMANDIAIVRLDKPIKFGSTAMPACLPAPNEQVPDGSIGTVAGWGHTQEGAWSTSDLLMQVPVPTVPSRTCAQNYQQSTDPMTIVPQVMLCAGHPQGAKDACQGDSGGPLTYKGRDGAYYLQGVVSFGEGCARAGKPGIYARVSNYIPWIQSKIQSLSGVFRG
jgi:transmembrane serine protease 3